ncbi:MAG: signal peptidase II [Acidobacteria bacterium]|nr:signal peptidase II [Acidobacteriota bacterium]
MTAPQRRDWRGLLLMISAVIVALDRWTKYLVHKHIASGDMKVIIHGTFGISNLQNNGAAFSLFADSASPSRTRWMLIAFSLFAALVVLLMIWKAGRRLTATTVALALVLGGAVGNLWDRVFDKTVTDFIAVNLHFGSWHYHWPDFNIADSAIVIGGLLLLLDALRGSRETDKAV